MSEGSFEAKLTAKRETAAGIYLTVQVQPEDYQAELATLRVGSALMLGWAEIVNTAVEPIECAPVAISGKPDLKAHGDNLAKQALSVGVQPDGSYAERATKERRPFASLPLSQQAALRCQDNDFKLFLGASNAMDAAEIVRKFCGVSSRSELDEGNNQVERGQWRALDARYQAWLTDLQYAGARR